MDDLQSDLERQYCPPIDPALLYALISDYDLSLESSREQLRVLLDAVKGSAEEEELTTADRSGSSPTCDVSATDLSPDRAQSWHGDVHSEETEVTNVSQSLASFSLSDKDESTSYGTLESNHWEENVAEELSIKEKATVLQRMFPAIKAFDIDFALKRSGGRFDSTVEDLLNQAFFEEERLNSRMPPIQKGIDGFAESTQEAQARGRRGKGKWKKQHRRTSSTPAPDSVSSAGDLSAQSRWDRAREDIEFIAQRVYVPRQTITSTYHKSGASLPSTITALCSVEESAISNPYLSSASPSAIDTSVRDLYHRFPNVSQDKLERLIRITYPSTASAEELVRVLDSNQSFVPASQIMPQYSPRPATPPSPTFRNLDSSSTLPVAMVENLAAVRSTAFSQANAAYRKSKSKPLMAGAAGYYSSVGRDAAAQIARHEAATADALVSQQSRAGEVDLHGTNVKNAVRISRSEVQKWWDNGAAEWARQGKVPGNDGLRIVTGIGRHSEGGRSKIGPAVGAMLVREGWRVEVGEGTILVRGRVRK
ncbi:MAG: hypothetical protein Q9195_000189 [Heterodermia aff. obscurata]